MGGKNHQSAERATEALKWLPRFKTSYLVWSLELQPTKTTHLVMASVCLYHIDSARGRTLLRRWGESANPSSPAQVYGAWLRAAISADAFVEGVAEEDLIKLAEWSKAMDRP